MDREDLCRTCSGDTVWFVTPPEDKYFCSSCGLVLHAPILQTPCGHRISQACARILFKELKIVPCPAKEDGCCTMEYSELNPDRATDRELLRLFIYCAFKDQGCTEVITLGKRTQHEANCSFKIVHCPNEGCTVSIRVSDQGAHENECDFAITECENCDVRTTRIDILNGHKDVCKPTPKKCPLFAVGCSFAGLKDELERHLASHMLRHIQLIVSRISHTDGMTKQLENSMRENEGAVANLKSTVASIQANSGSNAHILDLDTKVDHLTTTLAAIQQQVASTSNETQLSQILKELSRIGNINAQQETRLSYLEQRSTRDDASSNSELPSQVRQMETTLGNHDVKLAETDIRFRLIETACYQGKLLWKITQYQRRKRDAREGRTLSLYSQPFYTSIHGYKMCGRVYLNGDGLGKGTHLSLFFVIMKGEYDALQQWPFRPKVTLSVLDQSGNRRHITDAFRPDPTSSSFRRPVQDMNIASGSPMFAKHEQVENGDYLRDDTLFIKISVDTTELQEI